LVFVRRKGAIETVSGFFPLLLVRLGRKEERTSKAERHVIPTSDAIPIELLGMGLLVCGIQGTKRRGVARARIQIAAVFPPPRRVRVTFRDDGDDGR